MQLNQDDLYLEIASLIRMFNKIFEITEIRMILKSRTRFFEVSDPSVISTFENIRSCVWVFRWGGANHYEGF